MGHDVLLSWKHLIHRTRFDELIKIIDIRQDEKVADIGCSRGHFVYEFSKRGAYSFGIDINKEHFSNNVNNLRFVNGSIFNLPIKNNTLDKVFISEVLISLPLDPTNALIEVYRVLRPGGRLILCNSKGYEILERFFYSNKITYKALRYLLSLILKCRYRDVLSEREKVIRYLGIDKQYHRNFKEDETVVMLSNSGFKEISFSYHFRKKVSDLLGLLLILRITLGLSRYTKALNWDYWFLFPVFKLLEKIDNEPGSGVVFTAKK